MRAIERQHRANDDQSQAYPDHETDRDHVVLNHLGLADAIARQYAGKGLEFDDLQQVARLALCKAAHRFRPERGCAFAAYAAPTIAGEIKRHFRDHAWTVRPPRRLQELHARIVPATDDLRARSRQEPDDRTLADTLGVAPDEVRAARLCEGAYHSVPLDGSPAFGAAAACTGGYAAVDDRLALHDALLDLTDREQRIVRLRFVEDRTQAEIGAELGVSQMQVSRLLAGILDRLRALLGDPAAA